VLAVSARFAPGCGPEPSSLSIQLEALGDFEASTLTSDTAPGNANAQPLAFPAATRAVSSVAQGGGRTFLGLGELGAEDGIDLLLWRQDDACEVWPSPQNEVFPSEAKGVALGVLPNRGLLLGAGALVATADAASAFTVNLSTGAAAEVANGMIPGRAYATITPFGEDALLVAGGVDPSLSPSNLDQAPPIDSATIYDADQLSFDRSALVPLSQPRARHAAVVLANGETLLVGGVGPNGAALQTLESVSPVDHAARVAGLATLTRARVSPIAFRLSDDRIFVGGGFRDGAPVNTLEWLDSDASSVTLIQENVVLAPGAAFTAMPGGSVLGVGVCVPKQVSACAGTVPNSKVVWIRTDGTLDELPDLSSSPDATALIPATNAAPWLLAWAATTQTWKRFDPWTGLFDEVLDRPSSAPEADLGRPLAVEPGLFVWLERGPSSARLLGFRHDVRGTYARDVAPLLLSGREHVAPSRAPLGIEVTGIEYTADGLGLAGTHASAHVMDSRYDRVTAELTLASGPPPRVLLGRTELGGSACPWPAATAAQLPEVLTLRRRGTQATLERGGVTARCSVEPGRLEMALAGTGGAPTRLRALSLRRE